MSSTTANNAPTPQQVFDELADQLKEAAAAVDKLKVEKNVDVLEDLKYQFYSNLLEVQDTIKDMLKSFRKRHKMTEKEVRERMAEEEETDAEDEDGDDEPEEKAC